MNFTREELRLMAAGQAAVTNGYQADKSKVLAFVEGAMWAFDFLLKKEREKIKEASNEAVTDART